MSYGALWAKRWCLYTYCPEGEVIVALVGGVSAATARKFYRKLEGLQLSWYRTNKWGTFAMVSR